MDAAKVEKEMKMLGKFVEVYCHHHHDRSAGLCDACADLLAYARARLEKCPFDPKPKCKACQVHCYRGDYRDRIRQVMRFSGMHFVKRGRLDWLIRYFLSR